MNLLIFIIMSLFDNDDTVGKVRMVVNSSCTNIIINIILYNSYSNRRDI